MKLKLFRVKNKEENITDKDLEKLGSDERFYDSNVFIQKKEKNKVSKNSIHKPSNS